MESDDYTPPNYTVLKSIYTRSTIFLLYFRDNWIALPMFICYVILSGFSRLEFQLDTIANSFFFY